MELLLVTVHVLSPLVQFAKKTRGLMRPRNMQASPAQQKQEVVESAIKTLNKFPRVNGIDGVRYAVAMLESESLILWDESREIIVHEQRVDFYDDLPPTTETILGRPLRNLHFQTECTEAGICTLTLLNRLTTDVWCKCFLSH